MQSGKNIKVFLSSTFKDMDAERDVIMNRVAPTLQQLLEPQGITVQFIDLRWGVNTQDADEDERENMVLRECISEIRQSRPFFIGLLGDRYGWMPSEDSWQVMLSEMTDEESNYIREEAKEQKSVTELEILFGALMGTDALRRSLFCFRKPDVYEQMNDDARRKFCNQDAEADRKLAALKKKIVDGCHNALCSHNVYEYDCKWNGVLMTGLEDFALFLVKTLHAQILLYEGSNAVENPTNEFQQLMDEDLVKISQECAHFISFDSQMASFNNMAEGNPVLLLYSENGYGKTASLCYLYQQMEGDEELTPFIHFARRGDTPELILKKWLADPRLGSKKRYAMDEDVPFGQLVVDLESAVSDSDIMPFLMIDNLHNLENLHVFLHSELTKSWSIIATTEIDQLRLFDGWEKAKRSVLRPITADEAGELINARLAEVGKTLPASVLEKVKVIERENGARSCGCPLWDVMMVRKLTNLTAYDYQKIRERGDGDAAIESYLCELVDYVGKYAPYTEQLFVTFLHDACVFLPFNYVWALTKTLAGSEFGLREQDFEKLAEENWDSLVFASWKRWMGDLLKEDPKTGIIDFAYRCFRNYMRYIEKDEMDKIAYCYGPIAMVMAARFDKDNRDDHAATELAYMAVKDPEENLIKSLFEHEGTLIWNRLADAVLDLVIRQGEDAFFDWLRKVMEIERDAAIKLVSDVACRISFNGDYSLAAALVEPLNKEVSEDIRKGEWYVYDPSSWAKYKKSIVMTLLHFSGFMHYTGDNFMSRLMLSMAEEGVGELQHNNTVDVGNLDYITMNIEEAKAVQNGEEPSELDISFEECNANELIELAELCFFTRMIPEKAIEALDVYDSKKGDVDPFCYDEIMENVLRIMYALQQRDVQPLLDYYDILLPGLKSLPDERAVVAASTYLLLWNIVRKSFGDGMRYRAEEANQTYHSVLRVWNNHQEHCEVLLQLCFYNLCSASELSVKELLYHGEHENAKKIIDMLRDSIKEMRDTHTNMAITITGYSLANAVFSNFFEQMGDFGQAFYYQKQLEYTSLINYQRFGDGHQEVIRRYATALDETGRCLYFFFKEYDQAKDNICQAKRLFEELYESAPQKIAADDLLACIYNYMQVLRAAGQFEEEISLAEETFAVINSHPEAMPEERLMANVKDDLGEIYDMLGRTHEAVSVMKEAGLIFANLLESDSENENYMRSYVINQVRTAKVLALKVGNTAEARQNLDETEKIVTKLRQMMPNSLKVRDIAMEYFITRAQVEIADNEMETAKENWSMVIGNLYNGITKNQRAVDIPLFVNFLVRLFRTAIDTGHLELANEFVSVEIQAKKEFMDLRLITLENADMDSTMDRYDLVENLKNNN